MGLIPGGIASGLFELMVHVLIEDIAAQSSYKLYSFLIAFTLLISDLVFHGLKRAVVKFVKHGLLLSGGVNLESKGILL